MLLLSLGLRTEWKVIVVTLLVCAFVAVFHTTSVWDFNSQVKQEYRTLKEENIHYKTLFRKSCTDYATLINSNTATQCAEWKRLSGDLKDGELMERARANVLVRWRWSYFFSLPVLGMVSVMIYVTGSVLVFVAAVYLLANTREEQRNSVVIPMRRTAAKMLNAKLD